MNKLIEFDGKNVIHINGDNENCRCECKKGHASNKDVIAKVENIQQLSWMIQKLNVMKL